MVLANSIDHDGASSLYAFMRANGVTPTFTNAESFDEHKYVKDVIILGGHGAPEGVGDIVDQLLTSSQKQALETPDATAYHTLTDEYSIGQHIHVLAGYTEDDTQMAWNQNKDALLEALQR